MNYNELSGYYKWQWITKQPLHVAIFFHSCVNIHSPAIRVGSGDFKFVTPGLLELALSQFHLILENAALSVVEAIHAEPIVINIALCINYYLGDQGRWDFKAYPRLKLMTRAARIEPQDPWSRV